MISGLSNIFWVGIVWLVARSLLIAIWDIGALFLLDIQISKEKIIIILTKVYYIKKCFIILKYFNPKGKILITVAVLATLRSK